MSMTKINYFLLIFYVFCSFFIKYFGFLLPFINDSQYKYCYKSFKNIAKKNLQTNMAGIIIKHESKLDIIPIFKKIIGVIMIKNDVFFIDSYGDLFQSNTEKYEDYITISGEYQYWHLYYEELEKYPEILQKIFHTHIYHHRIDLYLLPGILLKLNRSIEDLSDFYHDNPSYFEKKNYYLDLRNPKRVAYAQQDII